LKSIRIIRSFVRATVESIYSLLTGRPQFRAKYDLAKVLPNRTSTTEPVGLAYIVPPKDKGAWILNAICREIDEFVTRKTATVPGYDSRLPSAFAYFFSHYDYYRYALRNGVPQESKSIVFFTHPKDLGISADELCFALNQCHRVVSMCQHSSDWLVELGVAPKRIEVATIGADPDLFPPHERANGAIGFCAAFYERKNPERVLDIVKAMPHRQFVLLGRNWSQWDRFTELKSLSNLKYEERPYAEYPLFYRNIDVFVSASILEGGPVPLVEAMMSNVVPVASNTGIAPDIIQNGHNGFVFDVDADTEVIASLIEQAFLISTDIRRTVQHLTWERFSMQIQSIAGLN